MAAAGAGAAVLLVGAGFLAGTQFGASDPTRLVSDRSAAGGHDLPGGSGGPAGVDDSGRGEEGGRGFGGDVDRGGDGDGDGPFEHGRQGAAAFVTGGRITAISGSTLTLDTRRGTATVTTTSSTTIRGAGTGAGAGGTVVSSPSALSVGQLVFVAGTKTGESTYQANSIMTAPVRGDGAVPRGHGTEESS